MSQSGIASLTAAGAGGNVDGPVSATSTDNAVVRWDGTTGRLIQDSGIIADDSNNVSGVGTFSAAGDMTVSRANSGPVISTVKNTTASSGAHAQLNLEVQGASGGDARILYTVSGVGVKWYVGLDNLNGAVDDSFVIGRGSGVGTNAELTIRESGIAKLENGVAYKLTTTATSYNVLVTDYFIGVTDNTVARTITLPSTAIAGQTFTVKDQAGTAGGSAGGFAITVDAAGGKTIDGTASATINSDYGSLRFYYDGTNYFIY